VRRRTWIALATAVAGVALFLTLRRTHPQPETFAIDESLPAGAVCRIGSRIFGHVGGPNHPLLALSGDGSRLFTCDDEGIARAWRVDDGAPLWQVAAHSDMHPAADGPLDRRLARLWDAFSGRSHEPPRDLVLSPDGTRLATCAAAMIRVFDAATGRFVAERRTEHNVDALAWSTDGRRLYRAGGDRIAVWDVDAGTESWSAPLGSTYIDFAVRADGALVVRVQSQTAARTVALDAATLASLPAPPQPPDGWSRMLVFDDRGRTLVCKYPKAPGERFVWNWFDSATGTLEPAAETERATWSILDSDRSRQLVVTRGPAGLGLLRTGAKAPTIIGRGSVGGAELSSDGRRAAFATLGRARVHDVAEDRRLHPEWLLVDPARFRVLPDGRRVVAAADDGALVEIEIATGRVLRTFDLGRGDVDEFILSTDGRIVAGRAVLGAFRADLTSGEVASWKRWPNDVAFRGADVIGVSFQGQGLCVLDVATGTETPLESGSGGSFGNASFSADGTRWCADVKSGRHVWDTRTGKIVEEPPFAASQPVCTTDATGRVLAITGVGPRGATVTPKDRIVIDGRQARYVAKYDVDGTTLVAIGAMPGERRGFLGRRAVGRTALIVLVADDGRTVATFTAPDGPVVGLEFVPGGRFLLSGHEDGTILVWDLSSILPR